MSVDSVIKQRRSIRKYTGENIDDLTVKKIINAARLAPSGCNVQGWTYKIVRDKELIKRLGDNKVFKQEFVCTAPVIIFCCYNTSAYNDGTVEDDIIFGTDRKIRAIRDLSIASSFLVLRAHELGLGTCYIGWIDNIKAKKILNISARYEILFAISVGYPNEYPPSRPRKSLEEIII